MANFVQVVNNEVVGRYDILPDVWDGKNLKELNSDELKALGWYSVVVEEPLGWDGNTHKLLGPEFTIRENDVFEKYTLVPRTEEELAEMQQATQSAIVIALTNEQIQSNQEVADLVARLKNLTSQ